MSTKKNHDSREARFNRAKFFVRRSQAYKYGAVYDVLFGSSALYGAEVCCFRSQKRAKECADRLNETLHNSANGTIPFSLPAAHA